MNFMSLSCHFGFVFMKHSRLEVEIKGRWTTHIFGKIQHMDLVLSSEMQHRPFWQNKTTFTIPIYNMLGLTSIFQLKPGFSLTSAE